MIIRDNKTPRGRVVDMPPPPLHLPTGFTPLGDGETWLTMNRVRYLDRAVTTPLPVRIPTIRSCDRCGQDFEISSLRARFCSARCRRLVQNERRRINRPSRAMGPRREPAPPRPVVTAQCVSCPTVIEVHHGGPARRYCSTRCRGRWERACRKAAA